MSDDLVIDHNNFSDYFSDVKFHGPKPGEVMARYVAKAELVAGEEKGYLIDLLITNPKGAEMGVQMTQNLFGATESDAIRVCKRIAEDLILGLSKEEVMEKPYDYTLEKFYWTKGEYVPKDDPHWQVIKITMLKEKEEDGDK